MARWFAVTCLTALLVGVAAATPNTLIVKQHAMIGNLGTVTGGAGVVDNGVFAEKGQFSSITADQVQLQGNPAIVGNLVVDTQAVEFTSVEAEDADIGNAQADVGTVTEMSVDELTVVNQFTALKVSASQWTSTMATITNADVTTLEATTATITTAEITGNAVINTADINAATVNSMSVGTANIDTAVVTDLTVSSVLTVGTSAEVDNLTVDLGTVTTLTVTTATVDTLSGTTMTYNVASGTTLDASSAVITLATITTLDSTTANIDAANIEVGDIDDATIAFATIDSLQVKTANVVASATFNEIDTESFSTGLLQSTNTVVSGTLDVSGTSTMNSGLTVNGAFSVTGTADISGNINIDGILDANSVTANSATVTNNIDASTVNAGTVDAATFTGSSATLTGDVSASSANINTISVSGTATIGEIDGDTADFAGNVDMNNLSVSGSATVSNTLQATGTAQFNDVTIDNSLTAATAELTDFTATTATLTTATVADLALTSTVTGAFDTATFSGDVQFDAAVVINGDSTLADVAVNGNLEATSISGTTGTFNFVTVTDGVVANKLTAQSATFETLRADQLTASLLQVTQIVGDVVFDQDVDVNGQLTVNTLTGGVVNADNLAITDTLTANDVDLSGSATIASAKITTLDATDATITDASVSGELQFTGTDPVTVDVLSASQTLVTGQFDVSTSLDVSGALTATDITVTTANVATLTVNGGTTTMTDLDVNGDLTVTTDATFQGGLDITGTLSTNQFDVTTNANVGGSAEVTGLITGNAGLDISGGDSTIDIPSSSNFKITSDGVTWVDLDTTGASPQLTIGDDAGTGAIDFEGVTRIPLLSAGGTTAVPVVSIGLGSFTGNGDFIFTNPASASAAEDIFTVRTDNTTNVDLFSVATTDAAGTTAVTYDVDTFDATVSDRLDLNTTTDNAAIVLDATGGTATVYGENGVDLRGPVTARPTGSLNTGVSMFRVCADSACGDSDLLFDARADSVRFGAPLHFYSALSHSVNIDASASTAVVTPTPNGGLATYTVSAASLFGNQFFNFRNIGPEGAEQATDDQIFQILFPELSSTNFGTQGSIALQGKVITLMGYEKIPGTGNGNWISAAGFPIESTGFSALWAASATDTFPTSGGNQWLTLDSDSGVFANGDRDAACTSTNANRDAWSLTLLITAPAATADAALGTYDDTVWQLVYTPIQFAAQPLASIAAEFSC